MKKVIKKKITIEDLSLTIKDLSLSMNKGFRRVENLIEKKIDGLAISTAKGFESVDKRFEDIEKKMATKDDIKNMATKTDIEGLKDQIQGVNNRIDDFVDTRVKYEDHNKLKV